MCGSDGGSGFVSLACLIAAKPCLGDMESGRFGGFAAIRCDAGGVDYEAAKPGAGLRDLSWWWAPLGVVKQGPNSQRVVVLTSITTGKISGI